MNRLHHEYNFKPPLEPLPWQSGHSESTLQHVLEPECAEDGIGASSSSHEAGFTDRSSRTNACIQDGQSIFPRELQIGMACSTALPSLLSQEQARTETPVEHKYRTYKYILLVSKYTT
jgi:hypothetical protein